MKNLSSVGHDVCIHDRVSTVRPGTNFDEHPGGDLADLRIYDIVRRSNQSSGRLDRDRRWHFDVRPDCAIGGSVVREHLGEALAEQADSPVQRSRFRLPIERVLLGLVAEPDRPPRKSASTSAANDAAGSIVEGEAVVGVGASVVAAVSVLSGTEEASIEVSTASEPSPLEHEASTLSAPTGRALSTGCDWGSPQRPCRVAALDLGRSPGAVA